MQENIPTIILSPSRQEVRIFDIDQPDGRCIEEKHGRKFNFNSHAGVLGALSVRGVGVYTLYEISAATEIGTNHVGHIAKRLARLLPEYVAYDHGLEVLQDFSTVVALSQPGDEEVLQDPVIRSRQESQGERIAALQERLDELVAEMTYTEADIEHMDKDKTNLYDYDNVRISFKDQETDYLIHLIDTEDIISARILIEFSKRIDSDLVFEMSDEMTQRIWQSMPQKEREVFSNTYCIKAPKAFTSMLESIMLSLDYFQARQKAVSDEKRPMRRIVAVSLVENEPTNDQYNELSVRRHDKTKLPQTRYKQQVNDRNERREIVSTLHSLGVDTSTQTQPFREKLKARYSPESQLDLEPEVAHLIENVLAGDGVALTQPEAVKLICAATNSRFYRAIENLALAIEQSVTLSEAIERLEQAARAKLGDTYHGFATGNPIIGSATVQKIHWRNSP